LKLKLQEIVNCDVLVIGSGGAGLRSAIAAKKNCADVLLVSKGRLGRATNTYISKAIIAAAGWGVAEDNKNVHIDDTVKGGCFLNDYSKVFMIAERIGPEIAFLKECGVSFEVKEGKLHLLKTPGHRHARHVHGVNWTGSDLVLPLIQRVRQMGILTRDHVFITRLLTSDGNIAGAAGITPDRDFIVIRAKTVVLATGGYAQIFLNTNNASGITGDGLALAYEVGVALKDMEFVQFYPTAAGKRGNKLLLYERLLAQKGVVLKNRKGEDIIRKNGIADPTQVTRDQLAQIIMKEIKDDRTGSSQQILMDLAALSQKTAGELAQLLPSSWWEGQKQIEVTPTAHFCMGGVVTDQWGETSQKGLYAVGEVSAGAHGANRLGGNALAEVFSMGSLAGMRAAELAVSNALHPVDKEVTNDEIKRLEGMFSKQGVPPKDLIRDLKTLMWNNVGIIREKTELEKALEQLRAPLPQAAVENPADLIKLLEYRNMHLIAEMVCIAALQRNESRGSHYRTDYSEENNSQWLKNILFRKGDAGIKVDTKSVTRKFEGQC
jgi:fumarate reductase (CoM/CoB) subunit A